MDVRKQPEAEHCPLCGDDYTHIEAIRVNAGGRITRITQEGTQVSHGEPEGRGAVIETVFWCENGRHKWTRREEFHKGMVLRSEEMLLYVSASLDPERHFAATDLWRE
jgi:hypothetical protein